MDLIDAREPPELLVRGELDAEHGWRLSMPQPLRWPWTASSPLVAQLLHAGQADAVEAHHHARAARGAALCRSAAASRRSRRVMLKAYITFLPVRSAWSLMHAHHRVDALVERRVRRVGHQLVVLDEVDPRRGELSRPASAVCCGRQADAGLDDRADDRAVVDAGELPGAVDAELRAGIGVREGGRDFEVHQLQPGELPQLVQVAAAASRRASAGCCRRSPATTRPSPRPGVAYGPFRSPGCTPGRLGVSTVSSSWIRSTRARNLSCSSSVSPGTRVNRAGGLLAGQDLHRMLHRVRSFDKVRGQDAIAVHIFQLLPLVSGVGGRAQRVGYESPVRQFARCLRPTSHFELYLPAWSILQADTEVVSLSSDT